jgi:large subunit ribosomal protein L36
MKVRASIKKRSVDCKIVKRGGKLYVINKRILVLNKDKGKSNFEC